MKDFLIKEGVLFGNGDIVTGVSDQQNMDLLIRCAKGSFKQYPDATVGAADYLEDEDEAGFVNEIRRRFTEDGITIEKIKTEEGKLKIDAGY